MSDFTEKIKMRGKAEEDIYFAKLNQKLVEELHKKMAEKAKKERNEGNDSLTEEVTDPENPPK
ncbi:MAG TPA: hypothetical protein VIC51_08290 [Psychromonas sp.]